MEKKTYAKWLGVDIRKNELLSNVVPCGKENLRQVARCKR